MALISPRLPVLLGIEGAQARVLARFSLDDGVLSGISVDGPAILAALAESGTPADPEELADVFGAATPIKVTLADSGADVVIEPPSPSAVIDLGSRRRPAAAGPVRVTRALAIGLAAAMLAVCVRRQRDGGDARPPATRAAREAVTALAEANTGHFASRTAGAGGVLHSTFEGDYQLTPPAARATCRATTARARRGPPRCWRSVATRGAVTRDAGAAGSTTT